MIEHVAVDALTYKRVAAVADAANGHYEPYSVVGGLALQLRLGGEYRPTVDVDLASSDYEGLMASMVSSGASPAGRSVVFKDVSIDVIEVPPETSSPIVEARRFGVTNSSPVPVQFRDQRATVNVATPAALIVMKLHSLPDRRTPDKRAVDAIDILSIAELFDVNVLANEIASGPSAVAHSTMSSLNDNMFTNLDITLKRASLYGANHSLVVPEPVGLNAFRETLADAVRHRP